MRKIPFVTSLLFLGLLLLACPGGGGGGGNPLPDFNISFSVNPTSITPGQSTTLSWDVTSAERASAGVFAETGCALRSRPQGGEQTPSEAVNCKGSLTVTPAATTVYVLAALKQLPNTVEDKQVTVTVVKAPEQINVTILPSQATLVTGQSQVFTATVTGTSDTNVSWSTSCGSINGSGNTISYIAPATPGSCMLTATSTAEPSIIATATIEVLLPPGTQFWFRQFGGLNYDWGKDLAIDSNGYIYVTGNTEADPITSGADIFLTKFDASGDQIWFRRFGTDSYDEGNGVAVDNAGNVYVAGMTYGDLEGLNQGLEDAFLVKYDPDGNRIWARQFGSRGSDVAHGIAISGRGEIYITGYTTGTLGERHEGERDVFVAKYSVDGEQLWVSQFGTTQFDVGYGITTDSNNNVYLTGTLNDNIGGSSVAFVAKFDSSGVQQWIREFGTPRLDDGFSVAVDSNGNAYVTGRTNDSFMGTNPFNNNRYFLAKYQSNGVQEWIREGQLTPPVESGRGIAVNSEGDVYITGGSSFSGSGFFLAKYDSEGNQMLIRQDLDVDASGAAIAIDSDGDLYVVGVSVGGVDDGSLANDNAFIAKFSP